MTLLQSGIAKSLAEDYTIDQSLRFNDGDDAYLNRTPGSAGNLRTWTWSGWVKRPEGFAILFAAGDTNDIWNSSVMTQIGFYASDDTISFFHNGSYYKTTTQVFRDPSAWAHLVVSVDTTISSPATDRVKMFWNGERITAWSTDVAITENTDTHVNNTYNHVIGGQQTTGGVSDYSFYDGYLAEVHLVDGTALDADSFGETDSTTNQWKPKEYSGSYGTNGFYQTYSGTQDEFTKCLMHMDGADDGTTFTDSSTVGSTISVSGSVHTDTSVKKIGTASAEFDGTGDYLTIPANSAFAFTAGNTQTSADQGTIEAWAYFNNTASSHEQILCGGVGSSKFKTWELARNSSGYISGRINKNTSPWYKAADGSTTIPASTWVHMAMVRQGDDMRLYLNGVQDALTTGVSTYNDYNSSATYPFYVGAEATNNSEIDGYIDELRISSNCRYPDGTTFTPRTTAWSDTSIGADSSGNDNAYTPANLAATDKMLDSPTNNFCTLNPLFIGQEVPVLGEGNLQCVSSGSTRGYFVAGTIPVSSGKWYAEFYVGAAGNGFIIGAMPCSTPPNLTGGYLASGAGDGSGYYGTTGSAFNYDNGGTIDTTPAAAAAGDIISVLLDLDDSDGKIYIYKNNVILDTIITNDAFNNYNMKTVSDTWTIACGNNATWTLTANYGQDSSFAGALTAQGNQDDNEIGDFYYDVPAGYLALCTSNLPDPEIADPTAHFNSTLYDGNSSTNVLTGVGFQPDFSWFKARSNTSQHMAFDAVRGVTEFLHPDQTRSERTETDILTSFDSDGLTLGPDSGQYGTNYNTYTYVVWNWKGDGVAGGTLNEEGTIDSQVNANTTAGFSIIGYTGTAAVGTVGHGLSQAPELAIFKCRDSTTAWYVNATEISDGSEKPLELNSTSAIGSAFTGYWNDTDPGASVITLGDYSGLNSTGANIIYAFHSVEGYSKIGSYTGNDDADGVFIYTGFTPAFFLLKLVTITDDWMMFDNKRTPYNVMDTVLFPYDSSAEQTNSNYEIDFVSNGIKLRTSYSTLNDSTPILYMAFASSPFKYSNAR